MADSYHRSYLIIATVTIVVLILNSSTGERLQFEVPPEGLDYDDNSSIRVTEGQEVINSTLDRGGHYRAITVTISAFNAVYVMDLHLNTYLFAVGYAERSIGKDGIVYRDVNHTEDHCYYLGKVRDWPQSTAAVSTCKGIAGYFTIGDVSYHIHPRSNKLYGSHEVYRSRSEPKTNYSSSDFSRDSLSNATKHDKRLKRFVWPQDLDRRTKIVEIYVANAVELYWAEDYDEEKVIERTKEIVNIASLGYQPLGIYLVLVGVEVWKDGNEFEIDKSDENITVDRWASYRLLHINSFFNNDIGILISKTEFSSGLTGIAYRGMMCKNWNSAAVIVDAYPSKSVAAANMVRQIAHSFALVLDTDFQGGPCPCENPNNNCVMSDKVDSANPSFTWSQCSKDQFATSFQHGLDICLYNVPQTIQPNNAFCGNGIVESGEQCDCGNSSNQECNKACCNSTTCQLILPATCAYGQCCDINTCKILSDGALCRGKTDLSCDLAEFCDGINHLCPNDSHFPDGAACTVNGVAAYCYNGLCRSRESQCELLWGPGTLVSPDICYSRNKDGEDYGNCGIVWVPVLKYETCSSSDLMCGTLQCQDITKKPYYYLEIFKHGTFSYPTGETCHSAIFDFGLSVQEPGYVPSGTKCGNGKMCLNQRCLDIGDLNTTRCANPCPPSQVCNNLGKCQNTTGSGPFSTTTLVYLTTSGSTLASTQSSVTTVKAMTVAFGAALGVAVWSNHMN